MADRASAGVLASDTRCRCSNRSAKTQPTCVISLTVRMGSPELSANEAPPPCWFCDRQIASRKEGPQLKTSQPPKTWPPQRKKLRRNPMSNSETSNLIRAPRGDLALGPVPSPRRAKSLQKLPPYRCETGNERQRNWKRNRFHSGPPQKNRLEWKRRVLGPSRFRSCWRPSFSGRLLRLRTWRNRCPGSLPF